MLRLTYALLLFVALVVAGPTIRKDEAANGITPAVEAEVKPAVNDEPSTVASVTKPPASSPSSTTTAASSVTATSTTEKIPPPTTAAAPAPVVAGNDPPAPPPPMLPRKKITFDQRQEGKYNIRADLENFVIMFVPSDSSSGASLLELLMRSADKKDAHLSRKQSQYRRKNYKAHGGLKKSAQVTPEVIVLDESNQRSSPLAAEEFIEGRTPYKVDLSSNARSVEPSPGRLIRFPAASGNYATPQTGRVFATDAGAQGRALRVGGYASTNTLVDAAGSISATNNHILPGDGGHQLLLPVLGHPFPLLLRPSDDDADDGASAGRTDGGDNELVVGGSATAHRPLLVDHSHHPSSFDSLEYAPLRSDVDMTQLQLEQDDEGYEDTRFDDLQEDEDLAGWEELRLLGAQEQCGPDRKRDSYGVCQFVEP
ncbi:uncharacterized protein LOC128722671 [Anopheles nili]|uniref:uncharacterized protein LOC128722671 n=1 Tax=Anopheles nili TaxID=185578 RepID=UPI00237AF5EA|nr:uncharacterized protein LOC128722671 [Anopheles nili]